MELKQRALLLYKKHQYFVIMFLLFCFVAIFNLTQQTKPIEVVEDTAPVMPDTIIPKDYVLVPIELENKESITSILDQYGVIDVFKVVKNKNSDEENNKTSLKVLNKVKILRAPLNPDKFALLLKNDIAKIFLSVSGPFKATIQNNTESAPDSEQLDQGFFKSTQKKNTPKIQIEYRGS